MSFQDFHRNQNSQPWIVQWVKQNPVAAGSIALLGILITANSGNIAQNMEQMSIVQNTVRQQSLLTRKAEAVDMVAAEQAKIANARYQDGCLFVVAGSSPDSYVPLALHIVIRDAVLKEPLPAGAVVCDAFGNTGVLMAKDLDGDGITTPVVDQMAFTGDRSVVAAAQERQKMQAAFNNPEVAN